MFRHYVLIKQENIEDDINSANQYLYCLLPCFLTDRYALALRSATTECWKLIPLYRIIHHGRHRQPAGRGRQDDGVHTARGEEVSVRPERANNKVREK